MGGPPRTIHVYESFVRCTERKAAAAKGPRFIVIPVDKREPLKGRSERVSCGPGSKN